MEETKSVVAAEKELECQDEEIMIALFGFFELLRVWYSEQTQKITKEIFATN